MRIKNEKFDLLIGQDQINKAIRKLGKEINRDYKGKNPLFLIVLNGAFMFAADLMKEIKLTSTLSFIKLSSYEAMESTGSVKTLIGLTENIFQQDVIILEDIVDTGLTIGKLVEQLNTLGAKSISIATLLLKHAEKHDKLPVRYTGFSIEDKFVVGYGLDYDGIGRNLKDIYALA